MIFFFLIQSDGLCFLIEMFRPFVVNVIIYMVIFYPTILLAIFSQIVSYWLFRVLFVCFLFSSFTCLVSIKPFMWFSLCRAKDIIWVTTAEVSYNNSIGMIATFSYLTHLRMKSITELKKCSYIALKILFQRNTKTKVCIS